MHDESFAAIEHGVELLTDGEPAAAATAFDEAIERAVTADAQEWVLAEVIHQWTRLREECPDAMSSLLRAVVARFVAGAPSWVRNALLDHVLSVDRHPGWTAVLDDDLVAAAAGYLHRRGREYATLYPTVYAASVRTLSASEYEALVTHPEPRLLVALTQSAHTPVEVPRTLAGHRRPVVAGRARAALGRRSR